MCCLELQGCAYRHLPHLGERIPPSHAHLWHLMAAMHASPHITQLSYRTITSLRLCAFFICIFYLFVYTFLPFFARTSANNGYKILEKDVNLSLPPVIISSQPLKSSSLPPPRRLPTTASIPPAPPPSTPTLNPEEAGMWHH